MGTPANGEPYEVRATATALVPVSKLRKVSANLRHFAEFGFEVQTSGPHPYVSDVKRDPAFVPKFWVNGGTLGKFETLTVSWRSANQTVLLPDQGFLMTYGLIPRVLDLEGKMIWDDPEEPTFEVVVCNPISTYEWGLSTRAHTSIKRDFLQDYATVRKCALVQVFYEERFGARDNEIAQQLGNDRQRWFEYPEYKIRILDIEHPRDAAHTILGEVYGARILATPNAAPISLEDDPPLEWPGIAGAVTKGSVGSRGLDRIYVRDTVLAKFEDQDNYQIHPESGSVSNGNQWSVSHCERLGRDVIALELRKLYEGNRSATVRHWHAHAVLPPVNQHFQVLRREPNVASRTKRLVYGLLALAESISNFAAAVLHFELTPGDILGLSRENLDYYGWWKLPDSAKVARHSPLDLTEDRFLQRCGFLHQLAIERLSEKSLRRLVEAVSIPEDDIKDYRSLKLLDLFIALTELKEESGLRLETPSQELYRRLKLSPPRRPAEKLFALNDLRQLADHRAPSTYKKKFRSALKAFAIDPVSVGTGYGLALDRIYDSVIETIERFSSLVHAASH
jgi:hypothetical protein